MKQGLLSVLVLMFLGFGQMPAKAAVLINEILADPAADANGDGAVSATKDEFIELVNTDAAPVSLASWTLADALQVRHVFDSNGTIPGFGFVVVFGSSASSGGLSLNNAGDTVTLKDGSLNFVDAYTYGPEGGKDVAITRSPDGVGAFIAHPAFGSAFFSPGKTLDGVEHLPLPPVIEPPVIEPSAAIEPPAPPQPDPLPIADPDPITPLPGPDPVSLPDPHDLPGPIDAGAGNASTEPYLPPVPPLSDEGGPVVPEPSTWMLLGMGLAPLVRIGKLRLVVE